MSQFLETGDIVPTRRLRGRRRCQRCRVCKVAAGNGRKCPKLVQQAVQTYLLVKLQNGEGASEEWEEAAC